jgi:hypothetical protein
MSEMTEATWRKGKKVLRGRWYYYLPSDIFLIEIDKRDIVTGSSTQRFSVAADTPEWNGWKLVKDGEAKP